MAFVTALQSAMKLHRRIDGAPDTPSGCVLPRDWHEPAYSRRLWKILAWSPHRNWRKEQGNRREVGDLTIRLSLARAKRASAGLDRDCTGIRTNDRFRIARHPPAMSNLEACEKRKQHSVAIVGLWTRLGYT